MLGGGAAAALAGTGIYALVDRLTGTPVRRSTRPLIRSSTSSATSAS